MMRELQAIRDGQVIDLRRDHPESTGPTRSVSFVDLASDYAAHAPELDHALRDVLHRCDFILGEATALFEEEFAAYCGVAYAIGTDSGFSALELILRAFGIGPGDEVITAANTFYSTVRPIEVVGATPVLVDADPVFRNIDPALIEAAITPATRAILPVHLYGHPADMAAIQDIARDYGLYVFEDACQAHGSRHRGARVGALGDAAAFSFYPSKNLGAFGDAGIVVTDRPDVAQRLRRLRNLGSARKHHHEEEGFNRRLDTIQAAVLRVKLRHLDEANSARRRVARWYRETLEPLDVEVPSVAPWAVPVHHLYVVETDSRDELAAHLDELGVATGIHYPVPIHLTPAFSSLGYSAGDFPVAERLAERILSLPMHPHLIPADVVHVAESVEQSLRTS